MNVHFNAIRLHKVIDTDLLRAILNNTVRHTQYFYVVETKNLFYTFCHCPNVVSNLFSHFQAIESYC